MEIEVRNFSEESQCKDMTRTLVLPEMN
jgi:hypothetical protein